MGSTKNWIFEHQMQQYEDSKATWIQERLDDDEADESHERWEELSDEFDEDQEGIAAMNEAAYEDAWSVEGKSHFEIFTENLEASKEILAINLPHSSQKNLLVMLHGHIVSSVEGYLSSTFIENVLSSDETIRLLVETDPEFAKRKFTIKEIFTKNENLKSDIRKYLRDLIFHKISKVKPMYNSVFKIDFGDITWLGRAITLRHDCVHRAGYDKDGDEVPITKSSINTLIQQSSDLVKRIETGISKAPKQPGLFW